MSDPDQCRQPFDPAQGWRAHPGQGFEQAGLAGTIAPPQQQTLPGDELQAQLLDQHTVASRYRQVTGVQEDLGFRAGHDAVLSRPSGKAASIPRRMLSSVSLHDQARSLVPEAGLEPARPCGHRILSPVRLPISPLGQTL